MEIGGNLKSEAHQLFGSKPTVPLPSTLVHTLVWIFVVGPLHFDVAFLWVVACGRGLVSTRPPNAGLIFWFSVVQPFKCPHPPL